MSETTASEPWLRGPLPDIPAHVMPVFFSFAQVREDLRRHTAGLTWEQVWRRHGNVPALGFHLKHLAGSVDRLSTYLLGGHLGEVQLRFLKEESLADAGLPELLHHLEDALRTAEERLLTIAEGELFDARTVGRRSLPATVIGLLVHLAEHTQRHLGQAITTIGFLRQEGEPDAAS